MFESSVNPQGIETSRSSGDVDIVFESSVNPQGIETVENGMSTDMWFESSVNPQGIETTVPVITGVACLRAVLIHRGLKRVRVSVCVVEV